MNNKTTKVSAAGIVSIIVLGFFLAHYIKRQAQLQMPDFVQKIPTHVLQTVTTITSLKQCPSLDKDNEWQRGYRAIVAEDGTGFALKCADDMAVTWRADTGVASNVLHSSIFDAASRMGMLPKDLHCTTHGVSLHGLCKTIPEDAADDYTSNFTECTPQDYQPECTVFDHPPNSTAFVLNYNYLESVVATTTSDTLWGLSSTESPGVLLPRSSTPTRLIFVDGFGQSHPTKLRSVSLEDGKKTEVVDFDADVRVVNYSDAHNLLVTSFWVYSASSGDFPYVIATTVDGVKKWSIWGAVVKPAVGPATDGAHLEMFAGGRYATFAKSNNSGSFDIIDLADGSIVGTLPGWPLAASKMANRILIRQEDDSFTFVDLAIQELRQHNKER